MPATFLLKRLEARRQNNLRTALLHGDEKVRLEATARAAAYLVAIEDVKNILFLELGEECVS